MLSKKDKENIIEDFRKSIIKENNNPNNIISIDNKIVDLIKFNKNWRLYFEWKDIEIPFEYDYDVDSWKIKGIIKEIYFWFFFEDDKEYDNYWVILKVNLESDNNLDLDDFLDDFICDLDDFLTECFSNINYKNKWIL